MQGMSYIVFIVMATPLSLWDLSSLTGDHTFASAVEAQRLSHWAAREALDHFKMELTGMGLGWSGERGRGD